MEDWGMQLDADILVWGARPSRAYVSPTRTFGVPPKQSSKFANTRRLRSEPDWHTREMHALPESGCAPHTNCKLQSPVTLLMKHFLMLGMIVSLIATGTTRGQEIGVSSGGTTRTFVTPPGGPGSSYHKAIIIEGRDETSGIQSEYVYLQRHFPGCKAINHKREFYTKRTYDIITFTTPAGEKRALYFEYVVHR